MMEIWLLFERRRQGQLDREHRERLQRAQHEHELLLVRRRAEAAETEARVAIEHDPLMARLRTEAVLLSKWALSSYEPIRDGYGWL